MKTNKLTEGALLLAVFAVILLLTLYIPVLGVVMNFFLALPFIIFAGKNERKSSAVFLVAAVLISFIVGTALSIPLALAYGLMGLVIGDFLREKKGRLPSFIVSSVVFLIAVVAQYALSVVLFEINYAKELIVAFEESITQSLKVLESFGQALDPMLVEQLLGMIQIFQTLFPSFLVLSSLLIVFIVQAVSFPIVKRFGVDVPTWSPFREFQLPKSLLWYYLLTLLASLLLNPEQGTYWYTALMNISFIFQFFIILQGFSLIFYFAYVKGYPKFIPILIMVLSFLFSIFLYIVRILGIIDLGFDLRKRLEKK